MDVKKLEQRFVEIYGAGSCEVYFAPGRVNLIGEHTDYNGGRVFPCALSYGTYLLVRERDDSKVFFASENFEYVNQIDLNKIEKGNSEWVKYPLGVMDQFQQDGKKLGGLEFLFAGDIPNGAGLSSSASVEMATGVALNTIFDCGYSQIDLVKISQKAENEFVGVNCGIMDQFAVGMGVKNHALSLDCSSLDYDKVPLEMENHKLIIANTNKQRGLADSKYNERRSECESAVEIISKEKSIDFLCELSLDEFKKYSCLLSDEVILRRVKHVVSEHHRVLKAVENLKAGELVAFGQLMNASHDSLRDDYEVTGFELDSLVDEARKIKGVLGSRMTGAGFGGCTVSLVENDSVDRFIEEVGKRYEEKVGLKADFYVAEIGDGASKLEIL